MRRNEYFFYEQKHTRTRIEFVGKKRKGANGKIRGKRKKGDRRRK